MITYDVHAVDLKLATVEHGSIGEEADVTSVKDADVTCCSLGTDESKLNGTAAGHEDKQLCRT